MEWGSTRYYGTGQRGIEFNLYDVEEEADTIWFWPYEYRMLTYSHNVYDEVGHCLDRWCILSTWRNTYECVMV